MVSIAQKTPGQKLEHDKSRSRMTKKLAMRGSGVIGLYGPWEIEASGFKYLALLDALTHTVGHIHPSVGQGTADGNIVRCIYPFSSPTYSILPINPRGYYS